jgi:oligopeptide/dipeptide ABC transporter ATP-binding protein
MSGTPLIVANSVERTFIFEGPGPIGRAFGRTPKLIRAVDGVDLAIARGEIVGLVGESGSGKTTLGALLAGLVRPTAGSVSLEGDEVADERTFRSMRRRIQVVFQDAPGSLDPRRRVGSLVTEPYRIHRIPDDERVQAVDLLAEVGLPASLAGAFPHELSGGQARRVVIARALALRPEMLIADEPTSGLDVSTAATVLNLLRTLAGSLGLSMLVITHDLGVVASIADRVAVMYLGQIVEIGAVPDVLGMPSHPYTKALRSAVTLPSGVTDKRIVLAGEMPDPADPPTGCRFRTRCPWVRSGCEEPPNLRDVGQVRVRCHFAESIRAEGQPPR